MARRFQFGKRAKEPVGHGVECFGLCGLLGVGVSEQGDGLGVGGDLDAAGAGAVRVAVGIFTKSCQTIFPVLQAAIVSGAEALPYVSSSLEEGHDDKRLVGALAAPDDAAVEEVGAQDFGQVFQVVLLVAVEPSAVAVADGLVWAMVQTTRPGIPRLAMQSWQAGRIGGWVTWARTLPAGCGPGWPISPSAGIAAIRLR